MASVWRPIRNRRLGLLPLVAVALIANGCAIPLLGGPQAVHRPKPAEVTLPLQAEAAATSYMKQFEAGDYSAQWSELAPEAQGQWPSSAARTSMLQAKFQGDASILSFNLGAMSPAATWVSPEDPALSVAGGVEIPVTVTFLDPSQMQPSGVATDYQSLKLVLVRAGRAGLKVLGEGPASLDAPVIEPTVTRAESAAVPVLMYHVVAPFPVRPQWNSPYAYDLEYGLTVSPGQFAQQMNYLHSARAHAISLDRLADFLLYGLPLPSKPIVITFDDGRESPFQNAVPTLAKYGYTATFFVPSGLVGKFVTTKTGSNPQHYLSWAQVASLAHSGFWVEDHTLHDNVALWGLPAAEVGQLAGATAATLEQHTGTPVQFIAYSGVWPYPVATEVGPAQTHLFAELEALGYVAGAVDARNNSDRQTTGEIWQIPRVRVNPNEVGTQLGTWLG